MLICRCVFIYKMTEDQAYFVADKIKSGDPTAFRTLFRLYYPSLLSFVEGFVKDRTVSEDIVQNVFMKIWLYRASIDGSKPLRGYLFLLCRREVCSWFRKEVAVQRFVSGYDREEIDRLASVNTSDTAELNELSRIASEMVARMPEKRREVFILSRREGLTANEIALRLGMSQRTVNKHIQLALRSIRTALGQNRHI